MFHDVISQSKKLFRQGGQIVDQAQATWRGHRYGNRLRQWNSVNATEGLAEAPNDLWRFFQSHQQGPGIWKWNHYFPIYERHFSRFRGREVHVLEIGIYSGGSLAMWKDYFGPRSRIYGMDIEPACKTYETDSVKVFTGDQQDRGFWKKFRSEVNTLDIVIDDGGHLPEQQIVSLEELLPHLRPGGVYVCEDVHGSLNAFAAYVSGLIPHLDAYGHCASNLNDLERQLTCPASPFQSAINSIHRYPYVVVIERTKAPVVEFVAPKHGSQWQPFFE